MSADSSWDVQTGVYARLTGTAALTALLAEGEDSILDHVPAGTVFPYVVMGESEVRPLDTQRGFGNDLTLTLHSYSRSLGMKEIKEIMEKIYEALHETSFTVPNQTLILCRFLGADTLLSEDGLTRHGIQRFQIITEPA